MNIEDMDLKDYEILQYSDTGFILLKKNLEPLDGKI